MLRAGRDPNRIPDVINRVQEIWSKVPQLRLGQFLGNTCSGSDLKLYYIEDEDLLKLLENMYKDADKE